MPFIELAKVKIDNIRMQEALQKLEEFVSSSEGGNLNSRLRLIVTPNPEIIVSAQTDPKLLEILNNADLRLPDGISMVVVSRIKRTPLKERVAGIDFLLSACSEAEKKGWAIFLLGGAPGISEKAADELLKKYPKLKIVGTMHGYFKSNEDQKIISQIKNAKPDILFAGLGGGKQEKWLHAYLKELNVPVCMGVGGSMDVISGIKARAPRWVQALYIEWLYRLITEPQRWKRQLALPKFLWLTLGKNKR